jgi:hypothetical protein
MPKETYVAEFKILSKKFARQPEKKHYRWYNSWLSSLDLIPILKNSSYNCYPLEISQVVEERHMIALLPENIKRLCKFQALFYYSNWCTQL